MQSMGMYNFYYCVAECWSDEAGYDGVTEYVEVNPYIDYNIGQNGGQFIMGVEYWGYAEMLMMSAEEQ